MQSENDAEEQVGQPEVTGLDGDSLRGCDGVADCSAESIVVDSGAACVADEVLECAESKPEAAVAVLEGKVANDADTSALEEAAAAADNSYLDESRTAFSGIRRRSNVIYRPAKKSPSWDAAKRPMDTILNRVLARSSEFSVGTIRLSVPERIASLIIAATSFCWFWIFIQHQLSLEALPWCSVLMFAAILSLARYLSNRQISIFELLNIAGKSPVTFNQSFAFSYLSFSAAIWLFLFIMHGVPVHPQHITRRQVVDIELVSDKDYADHQDILPGSVPKPSLKSQKNDIDVTRRSPTPLSHQAPSASARESLQPSASMMSATREVTKPMSAKQTTKLALKATSARPQDTYIINVAEAPKPARGVPAANTSPGEGRSHSKQAVLEEVAPPEMVEITENQGDNGSEAFQPGGKSSGGTGRKALLVTYLKELHRRIKHAWKPPGGENHSAEILFRIKKTGTLASIKLVTSSGDSEIDESAMHAIAACSPFKALPADYPDAYLDLLYTFNYNVDELSELTR